MWLRTTLTEHLSGDMYRFRPTVTLSLSLLTLPQGTRSALLSASEMFRLVALHVQLVMETLCCVGQDLQHLAVILGRNFMGRPKV